MVCNEIIYERNYPMTTIALRIDLDTVELITVLNGGVRPADTAFGDYYVCDITDGDTVNHKIVNYDTYRTMRKNNQSSFTVNLFQD